MGMTDFPRPLNDLGQSTAMDNDSFPGRKPVEFGVSASGSAGPREVYSVESESETTVEAGPSLLYPAIGSGVQLREPSTEPPW